MGGRLDSAGDSADFHNPSHVGEHIAGIQVFGEHDFVDFALLVVERQHRRIHDAVRGLEKVVLADFGGYAGGNDIVGSVAQNAREHTLFRVYIVRQIPPQNGGIPF